MSSIVTLQTSQPLGTIPREQVTPARILSLLDNALFEVQLDADNDVYVTDGVEFPVWIRVEQEDHLLRLFTFISDDGAAPFTAAIADRMNANIKLAQFHCSDCRLCANFWIAYSAGLPVKQFASLLRRFSGAVAASLRMHYAQFSADPNKLS